MKTTYYKLTDENNQTKNGTQWGPGVTHTVRSIQPYLCSDGWIHFYRDPILAALMNPNHANFTNPNMWEAEVPEGFDELHEALKSGARSLTTIKQIPLPEITAVQKIAFGILCAKQVYKKSNFLLWADNWLSNKDRCVDAACASAAAAAYASAAAAAYAAASAAVACASAAAAASDVDACATTSAASAAVASAASAAAASDVDARIDFVLLAHEAMKYS